MEKMDGPLTYSMWEYQANFREHVQKYAAKLFQELSDNLKPFVFILGILQKHDQSSCPVCIEPEDCGIKVDLFTDAEILGTEFYDADPRKNIMYATPEHHQRAQEDIRTECLRNAVKQRVDENFTGKGRTSFVSTPVERFGYFLFVILQFEESSYNKFYALNRVEAECDELRSINVRRSLLDALVHVFLGEAIEPLYKPRPGVYGDEIKSSVKAILRHAAANFIGTAIPAASCSRGANDLFEICNYISSLKYENKSIMGKLIICKEQHPNIKILIRLKRPIGLHDYRSVRKLLEISSSDLHLYTNGNHIIGFTEFKGHYNPMNEDLFIIDFIDAHKWELIHDSHKMMIVEYRNPRLPRQKIGETNFRSTVKRIFADISDDKISTLFRIVNSAPKQKHGTLIIISKEAEIEASRLANQSTVIEPLFPDAKIMESITSIDGAIFLDPSGMCHAIGASLDGIATEHGTSARGARYNSAIRYVDMNSGKCIAIIISEDGMVDMYPHLRPQIRRNDIVRHLKQLRAEVSKQSADHDNFSPIMDWFFEHEFYLSEEICEEVNSLKKIVDTRKGTELSCIDMDYPDLIPNSEMNESYFLEERDAGKKT